MSEEILNEQSEELEEEEQAESSDEEIVEGMTIRKRN